MGFKEFMSGDWGKLIIRALAAAVVTVAVFLGVYYGYDATLKSASDGSFVAFAVAFGGGFFSLGNRYGFFTGFQYGMTYAFGSFGRFYRFKNGGTYGDFVETKKAKRIQDPLPFLPYMAVAVIWLIAAIVLLVKMNQSFA